MTQTHSLKTILQQPSLEEVQRLIHQISVEELAALLPTLPLNKRVLLFLLLTDVTGVAVFRQLGCGDRLVLLEAMEEAERHWLLALLTTDEQAQLLARVNRHLCSGYAASA